MIKVTAVPAFSDNYIWLIGRENNPHVALVDPGDHAPVLAFMRKHGLTPCAILITHHHRDHIGAIAGLLDEYDIPVYGPKLERIPHMSHPLAEGDIVALEAIDATFRVIDTPGHTAGHICYYSDRSLFCGDTLFTCGCGRLFEGTAEQMQRSLAKIRALPDDTRVYCAHEYTLANIGFALVADPDNRALQARREQDTATRGRGEPTVPSLLGLEKQTNPFLRWDDKNLIGAAEKFMGKRLNSPAEIFGAIRYWKDTLD
ncbi:MAG: hydroxyacylglutathione hydrolase [Pseudomonadota bacterium]